MLTPELLRCLITKNLCGTDTWKRGSYCKCDNCRLYVKQTPEPLTIERLYELCEHVKSSPTDRDITISREELWALVEMAKSTNEVYERAAMAAKKSILEEEDKTPLEYIAEGAVMAIRSLSNGGDHTPVPTDGDGNARPFGE